MMPKKMKKKKTTNKMTHSAIAAATLAVAAAAVISLNIFLRVPLYSIVVYAIGALIYGIAIHANQFSPRIAMDYVPSGEAAIALLAMYLVTRFTSGNPHIILALTFPTIFMYTAYLNYITTSETNSSLINGILAFVIIGILLYYLSIADVAFRVRAIECILPGYLLSFQNNLLIPAMALVLAGIIVILMLAGAKELRWYSQGRNFYHRSATAYACITIGMLLMRSALITVAIFFFGWMGGIGISVRSLYKGAFPSVVTIIALILFSQAMIAIMYFTSIWHAAAASTALSYILYLAHSKKKVLVYDRY